MKLESDRQLLLASEMILEDYLLSKDLFWSVGGRARRGEIELRLTLGNLLLSLKRVLGAGLKGSQPDEINRIATSIESMRLKWKVAWGKKSTQEWVYRLRLWSQYLSESKGEGIPSSYTFHVRQRVILSLLHPDTSDLTPQMLKALGDLDNHLKISTKPGGFMWEPELTAEFPPDPFWYLYLAKD